MENVHVFSDGYVVGEEVQGMAFDVLILGNAHRYVLPGVVLYFSGTRLVDEVVAFLWALHPAIGSESSLVAWCFGFLLSALQPTWEQKSDWWTCQIFQGHSSGEGWVYHFL